MQAVWLAKNGVQQGPLSWHKARQLIAQGHYHGHDLAWVVGSPSWTAIAEVEDLTSGWSPPDMPFDADNRRAPPPSPPASGRHAAPQPASYTTRPRPWRRYLARTLDTLIVGLAVDTLLGPMLHLSGIASTLLAGLPTALALMAYEACCLSQVHTTLGKHVFGIVVTQTSGAPITQTQSNARAWRVGIFGGALGMPILASLAYFIGYLNMQSSAGTSWDRHAGCTVAYRCVPVWQQLAATLLISGLEVSRFFTKFSGLVRF